MENLGIEVLTGITIVSAIVKTIVDRVRSHWPRLDGDLVNLLALALGFGATYVPDVSVILSPSWVERVAVGAAIAGVSSFFSDATKSKTPAEIGL